MDTSAPEVQAVPASQPVHAEEMTLHPTADAGDPDEAVSPASAERKPQLSAEGAARLAREEYGGRVLAVHWTGQRYRIKLLQRGEIRIVEIEGE